LVVVVVVCYCLTCPRQDLVIALFVVLFLLSKEIPLSASSPLPELIAGMTSHHFRSYQRWYQEVLREPFPEDFLILTFPGNVSGAVRLGGVLWSVTDARV
jgi:hypothetical protein